MIKQLLQFIQNHWMLGIAFLVITALLIFEEIKNKLIGAQKISVQNTTILLNRENAVVVDLRGQQVFANGHILGAINIPRAEIDHNLKKLEPYKEQALILIDDYDTNASSVSSKLQKTGFSKVYVLAGGLNSWKDAQLPLSKN